jgi:hypothetical protein
MRDISSLSYALFSFLLLFACGRKTNTPEEQAFDYITEISFEMPIAEFKTKLLSGFQLAGKNGKALSLKLFKNDINHEVLFLHYSDGFFHEAIVHLDFSKKQEQIDHVFKYLEKGFTAKYGKPYFSDVQDTKESHHSWYVEPIKKEPNRHITLVLSGQMITVQFTRHGTFNISDED